MSFWYQNRGWLARKLGVDLTHSQRRYARLVDALVRPGTRWLDIGCGRQLLPEWCCPAGHQAAIVGRARLLVGADVDPSLRYNTMVPHRVFALAESLPFRNEAFDLVTANVVVEHLHRPPAALLEVRRVLAPGGIFLFHTPNALNYLVILARIIPYSLRRRLVFWIEGRKEEDVFPTFYRMNTLRVIRQLAADCGMQVVLLRTVGSSGILGRMGPLGWLEVASMRLLAGTGLESNILCALRRPNPDEGGEGDSAQASRIAATLGHAWEPVPADAPAPRP